MNDALRDWLLEGDPVVRWQVRRDLLESPAGVVEAERERIASEGWGARLFALQGRSGRWGEDGGPRGYRGIYTPKWTSTTYTLLLLARMGLPPGNAAALAGCGELLACTNWFPSGGVALWPVTRGSGPEACVASMVLHILVANGLAAREPIERLTQYLLDHQFADGGWNCRARDAHASFNTTLLALDALALLPPAADPRLPAALDRGREFLLMHQLFRSHTTGNIVAQQYTRMRHPFGWQYDIVRALDHFASSGAARDERAAGALDVIRDRRRPDGTWRATQPPPGQLHFAIEPAPASSRWLTMRCLRALRWWGEG